MSPASQASSWSGRRAVADPLVRAIESEKAARRRLHDEAEVTDILASLASPTFEPAVDLATLMAVRRA